MKLYVITSGEYSDYSIETIFDKEILANEYCKFKNKYGSGWGEYRVEEYTLNDENNFIPQKGYVGLSVHYFKNTRRKYGKMFIDKEMGNYYKNDLVIGNTLFKWNLKKVDDVLKYIIKIDRNDVRRLENVYHYELDGVLYYEITNKTNWGSLDDIFHDEISKLESYIEIECEGDLKLFQDTFGGVKIE